MQGVVRVPTHKMSPSQRAKVDAEKMRIKEEKRREGGGVGPGSYEPNKPGTSQKVNLCGSTSFRSTTPRVSNRVMGSDTMLRDITMNTDCGAYNPTARRDFKAAAEKTGFNKSNAAGSGHFGSLSSRRLQMDIMGPDVPCPTMYGDEQRKGMAVQANKMNSSSFHSKRPQRPKPQCDPSVPPLGTYSPTYDGVTPNAFNPAAAMSKSKSSQIGPSGYTHAGTESSTNQHIGPGAYAPDSTISGAKLTIEGHMKRSASFGRSTAFRKSGVRDLAGAYFANESYYY